MQVIELYIGELSSTVSPFMCTLWLFFLVYCQCNKHCYAPWRAV